MDKVMDNKQLKCFSASATLTGSSMNANSMKRNKEMNKEIKPEHLQFQHYLQVHHILGMNPCTVERLSPPKNPPCRHAKTDLPVDQNSEDPRGSGLSGPVYNCRE